MTKAVWTKFITDNAGAVVEGASVTVFLSDGITPATIYSDPAGTSKANPFLTPTGGKAEFYADPGIYVIQASKDGKTATWNNEEIGHARRDLDLSDIESAATARNNLGLGTASTKNVTTTATDTTAGRLLKVGDFGLGVENEDTTGVDPLTNFVGNQIFAHISFTPTDWDSSLGIYPMGLHVERSSTVKSQFAMGYGLGGDAAWRNTVSAGPVWSDWRKLYDTANILGTVSQSGGVPTGAIMQYVTSGSNKAAKYTDGMLITWNDNAAITADPVAYVGTPTSIESGKLKIGRWY